MSWVLRTSAASTWSHVLWHGKQEWRCVAKIVPPARTPTSSRFVASVSEGPSGLWTMGQDYPTGQGCPYPHNIPQPRPLLLHARGAAHNPCDNKDTFTASIFFKTHYPAQSRGSTMWNKRVMKYWMGWTNRTWKWRGGGREEDNRCVRRVPWRSGVWEDLAQDLANSTQ